MALFFDKFPGFEVGDFSVFEERKQQSNRFNLERMKVREKLEALGKSMAGPVMQHVPDVKWGVTSHVPSVFNQRKVKEIALYFTRSDKQQRTVAPYVDSRVSLPEQVKEAGEFFRNLSLYVSIDQQGVQVGLRCHSTAYVDVMNLVKRLEKDGEADTLRQIIASLGEDVAKLWPDKELRVGETDIPDWQTLGDRVMQENFFISIYKRFDTTDPDIQKQGFQDQVIQLFKPLQTLFRFWLWSPDNDHLGLAKELKTKREVGAGAVTTVSVGAWVRVITGLFNGRRGKVMELDRKGVVRVKIGKVIIRLSTDEIRVLHPAKS